MKIFEAIWQDKTDKDNYYYINLENSDKESQWYKRAMSLVIAKDLFMQIQ